MHACMTCERDVVSEPGRLTRRTAFAVVDAFTTARAFSGNPAGVVLLDDLADEAWMQEHRQ